MVAKRVNIGLQDGRMKMEIAIAVLIGLVVGAGGTAGVVALSKDKPVETSATVQAQTAHSLSNMDVVEPVCKSDYIEANGNGLCREMFCWAQTNSTTGEASGIACETISNINNTITILDVCGTKSQESDAAQEACHTLFRERK